MKPKRVKLAYDPEVDAAYLTLAAGKVVESEEVQPGVIVDLDAEDHLLGVEILRFSCRFKSNSQTRAGSLRRRKAVRSYLGAHGRFSGDPKAHEFSGR